MTVVEYLQSLSMFERFIFGGLFGLWISTQLYMPFALMKMMEKFERQNARMVVLLDSISESNLRIQGNTSEKF